jgi:hypothetical protein
MKTRLHGQPHGDGRQGEHHDGSPGRKRLNTDNRTMSSSRERSIEHRGGEQESVEHWDPLLADKLKVRRSSSEPVQDAFFKAVVKEGVLLDPLSTIQPFVP